MISDVEMYFLTLRCGWFTCIECILCVDAQRAARASEQVDGIKRYKHLLLTEISLMGNKC